MRVCKPRIVSGCGHVGALARWWFLQGVRSRRLSAHFFAIFFDAANVASENAGALESDIESDIETRF